LTSKLQSGLVVYFWGRSILHLSQHCFMTAKVAPASEDKSLLPHFSDADASDEPHSAYIPQVPGSPPRFTPTPPTPTHAAVAARTPSTQDASAQTTSENVKHDASNPFFFNSSRNKKIVFPK
jgi:hypothetical protein